MGAGADGGGGGPGSDDPGGDEPGGDDPGGDATDGRLRLAELVATRLCHDLSGPLGTLMGALEMLVEEPESAEEALALAGDVAGVLTARLRLLRAAWAGGASGLGLDGFRAMAEGLATPRLRLDFDGLEAGATFGPAAARVALNVLLLAADSLARGGVIRMAGDPGRELVVVLDGPRAAWPVGFAGFIADPARAWAAVQASAGVMASRGVQAPLTALVARSCKVRLSLLMAAGTEAAPPLLITL